MKTLEVEWQPVCVRKPERYTSCGFSERHAVIKRWILESDKVIVRVVNGMIFSAVAFSAKSQVQRGDAQVLDEGRIIRSRAQRSQREVLSVENIRSGFGASRIYGLQ